MAEIEQVSDWSLAIAAEAAGSKLHHYERMSDDNRLAQSIEAHARAIEQHEAYKREVSDAVEHFKRCYPGYQHASLFDRFILPKPDPLAEAMQDWWDTDGYASIETFRAAIEARGGRIVWEGE